MLEIKKVKRKDINYKKIEELMLTSFPKEELFSFRFLNLLSKRRNCDYLSYYDDSKLIGVTYSYKYKDCDFVLNIEPLNQNAINYKERERRFNFYYKNGFYRTGLIFKVEPSYDILSTNKEMDIKKYRKLLRKMMFSLNVPKIEKE